MIAVIFEAEPAEGQRDAYLDIAAGLRDELMEMDGFISIERFESLNRPGKLLSLSFWRDEEAVRAWRCRPRHRAAQTRGRGGVFSGYRLRVASVLRDYGLEDRAEAPSDSPRPARPGLHCLRMPAAALGAAHRRYRTGNDGAARCSIGHANRSRTAAHARPTVCRPRHRALGLLRCPAQANPHRRERRGGGDRDGLRRAGRPSGAGFRGAGGIAPHPCRDAAPARLRPYPDRAGRRRRRRSGRCAPGRDSGCQARHGLGLECDPAARRRAAGPVPGRADGHDPARPRRRRSPDALGRRARLPAVFRCHGHGAAGALGHGEFGPAARLRGQYRLQGADRGFRALPAGVRRRRPLLLRRRPCRAGRRRSVPDSRGNRAHRAVPPHAQQGHEPGGADGRDGGALDPVRLRRLA